MKAYDKSLRQTRPGWERDRLHSHPPRRRDPLRHEESGFCFETYGPGGWKPCFYFRDEPSMWHEWRERKRVRRQNYYIEERPIRMRFPNDGKMRLDPPPGWWSARQSKRRSYIVPKAGPVSEALRERIQKTIEDEVTIYLVYRDVEGKITERHVFPVSMPTNLHLVAFCELRHDYRTFRLDRIIDCRRGE